MSQTDVSVLSLRRPLLFLTVLIGLSACAGTSPWTSPLPPILGGDTPPARSESPAQDATEAKARARKEEHGSDFYLNAAEQAEGNDRKALLLRAAEASYHEGKDRQALQILDDLQVERLPESQRRRATLLLAELGQFADRPLTLLSRLPAPERQVPEDIAQRIWAARANAHLALGQTLDAIHALVRQEQLIHSAQARRTHREHIWRTLRSAPPMADNPQEIASYDRETRGWVELANVMLDLWLGPDELRNAISQWERNYPGHPANQTILSKELKEGERMQANAPSPLRAYVPDTSFDSIALLLPLSGPYASAATAVRDGFMTAYYRRTGGLNKTEDHPQVLVFDTGAADNSIERVTEQAILAGADILVGPLEKDNVARLAQSMETPVPILALNYLENSSAHIPGFYQFGLSPEDEAAQVAERALADGRLNALAIVPKNDWGQRTLQAFQQSLQSKGGQLLDYAFFDPEGVDFREPITRLLRYGGKDQPIRSDMDYIFLAAQPQQARLIRPQLRFYRASRVPVYATSHIYSGSRNERLDQDLNGIRFGDMPWILDQNADLQQARDMAAKLWPSSYAQLPRLYALGFDAYALATQIAKNNLRAGFGYPAASGVLTLQGGGRISRGLVWAHFSDGRPRLLADKPPSEEPEESEEEGYLPEELLNR